VRRNQTPPYSPDPGLMLVMVLRRQRVTLGDGYFVSTCVAAIDARPRCGSAGSLELVKGGVFALIEEHRVFVQCHC